MDQLKIGKFIADCRKEKKITQAQLAERLCITDKAVSKWERGITMPDSASMLELCSILDINVNDLLHGERISAEDQHKKTEELLLEMTKKEEAQRKRLLVTSWVMFAFWTLSYFFIAAILFIFVEDLVVYLVLLLASLVLFFAGGIILVSAELKSAHYICQNCQLEFETNQRFTFNTITRKPENWKYYLKCPKCQKKTWAKRILPK